MNSKYCLEYLLRDNNRNRSIHLGLPKSISFKPTLSILGIWYIISYMIQNLITTLTAQ